MTPKEFDTLLRSLLGSHKIPVDGNEMWIGVQNKLSKKKKRRGILFFFLGIGLIISASLIGTRVYSPILPQSLDHKVSLESPSSITPHKKREQSRTNTSLVSSGDKPTNKPIYLAHKHEANLSGSISTKPSSIPEAQVRKEVTTTNQASIPSLSYPTHPILKILPSIPAIEIALVHTINNLKSIRLSQIFPAKENNLLSGLNLKKNWSLGFVFAYGKHHNSFQRSSDLRKNFYQTTRNTHETPLEQLNVGLTLRKDINKQLFFSSGIAFFRRTDIYTDTIFSLKKNLVTNIYKTYVGANVEAAYPTSLSISESIEEVSVYKVYNNYSGIEIPILLGYNYPFGSNALQISLGTSLHYRTSTKGFTTYEYQAVKLPDFSYGEQTVYPQMLYFTALGKLHFEHTYSTKTRAYLGITAEKSIGNILSKASGLSHQYQGLAFEAGFRYLLH